MKHTLIPSLLALTLTASSLLAQTPADLLRNFANPPADARPMVRWWWFGAAVEKPEILRELQQMKADGIGGAELAFVYPVVLDDLARNIKNLPFLSPAMLDAVHYAQAEGRTLGLRIDVTLCSGWPYGGPATTLAEAAGRLRTFAVPIPANATTVPLPHLNEGDTLLSAFLVTGDATHWDPAFARPVALPQNSTTLPLPSDTTPRVALFFVQSHTRQQVKRAAVGAEGFVLDPFSRSAVATHLRAVGEPLLSAFGSTPPYAIFSDSLEAYGADWTPTLPAEFLKRRGYDLLPHLPELVAGGSPAAEKIRHDYGQTLTELVNENYLVQINDWAHAHHTRFRSQTYGEPAVSFSSQRLVDLAEGEGPQWRAFSTLRWATSANHVFGNPVTSGETFTWLHSPVFRATPLDMKAEADIDFLMGENQLIFHGWPYSPPASNLPQGDPGWSLYAAAVFNDHNPWHPVMPAVTQYIARISWLLRQGKPANQVAILLPTDDAWAAFSPGKVTITGAMQKLIPKELMATILSAGYNVDFIDADAINTVGLGDHQIVILPPTTRIPLETLKKLDAFAHHGGKVLAVGGAPTFDANGGTSPELERLLHMVPFQNDIASLATALHNETIPDLKLADTADAHSRDSIGFIRRRLPNADVYFIANTSNRPVETRVSLATPYPAGQQWNPETGQAEPNSVTAAKVPLNLAPYESRIFIFASTASKPVTPAPASETRTSGNSSGDHKLTDLSSNWQVTFPGINKSVNEPTLTDWTTDPATLHYSGLAIYTRDFTLPTLPKSPVYLEVEGGAAIPGAPDSAPEEHVTRAADGLPNPLVTGTGPGMHAWFDPPLHEAALVTINGVPAGALWHPPYRLDVTPLLKPGTNHIEIRVYNTALNAWSANPPRDYKPLIAVYGDRFQMQDLKGVKPLPSGLLGPIHLVTGDAR